MKKTFILFLAAISMASIFGCSGSKQKNDSKDSLSTDTSLLSDKNFAYKNILDTRTLWKNHKFKDGKLYADSSYKVAFTELSKQQKLKLIASALAKELGQKDKNLIANLMQAFFIAKQDKIGEYQPIILFLNGDDYMAMKLVVLNKSDEPVDEYILAGGFDSGPYSQGDSLTVFPSESYSILSGGKFITYSSKASEFADSLKKPSMLDSSIFKSTIDNNGEIITKRVFNKIYRYPSKTN